MIETRWGALAEFQLHIAERWRDRGARSEDPFARYFFFFSGVNALYYLWSKVDDVRGREGGRPNEQVQIEHLLDKAALGGADALLARSASSVQFFRNRNPIERMDKRTASRARVGDHKEGERAQRDLRDGTSLAGC